MPFLKRPGQPDLHCTRYEEAFARNRPEVQKAMADLFHGISAEPYLPKIAAPASVLV